MIDAMLKSDSENFEKLAQDRLSSKKISFLTKLSCLPYRVWLLTLREVSLILILVDNFEKIPPKSPSKLIAGLFVKHSKMKKLLYKLEKSLRSKVY